MTGNSIRVRALAGLCWLGSLPLYGTSAAVITSNEAIVAAIDSMEVNREYLSDGTLVTESRISCKVRQTGPYYVLVAGISRASDGFDALQAAGSLYRDGDGIDDFAARLADWLPARLTPILNALRAADRAAFDQSFRGQDVLQMGLLGAEQGQPRALILTFRASLAESGGVVVEAHRASCPGDCRANAIYLLGMHDEAESFVHAHPEIAGDTSTGLARQLIQVEYASHPNVVGGPATVIRVTGGGAAMEEPGACVDPAELPQLEAELDRTIASVENVVLREDVAQHSKHAGAVRSENIQAVVRVVDGEEEYAWSDPRTGPRRLPQPWCGGELATMIRATRDELERGQGNLTADTSSPEPTLVMAFHATETDRHWQLVISSRTYPLGFDGRAWFSRATGKLLRIRWEATEPHLPASTGITRVEWDETFSTSEIAGSPFLTPSTAVYRVSYSRKADRTDWTETRFSGFRRFGATENVQFERAAMR